MVRPNLSSNDALQLANRILADLSAHERLVHAELPGELALTPAAACSSPAPAPISTRSTTSPNWTVTLSMLTHGFTERLRLKNIPPNPVT